MIKTKYININNIWLYKNKNDGCNTLHIFEFYHFDMLSFIFFFRSSPHLVHVRERIRINGDPLSEEDFVKYFEYIYSSLKKAVEVYIDADSQQSFSFRVFLIFILHN